MKNQIDLTSYIDRLYAVAIRKSSDPYVAEELVQETFLAALRSLSRGMEPQNVWSWLLRILSNKYMDHLREKYRKPVMFIADFPQIPVEDTFSEEEEYAEKLAVIRRELGFLAKNHREVLVRFYMHGQSAEQIAADLAIPVGTVKSRLNTGRRYIREGAESMENYVKQSYEPDILQLSISGEPGMNDAPFSLVNDDKLAQNILILSYEKPVTEGELSAALGIPAAYIESTVQKLVDGELMVRTDSGKVYTDFMIYTLKDMRATYDRQLQLAEEDFECFWSVQEQALEALRKEKYYLRQDEQARTDMELYFAIKILLNVHTDMLDEVCGRLPYSEYPYRVLGGRWFAMGQRFPNQFDRKKDEQFRKYGIGGEVSFEIKNFRDAKQVAIRKYEMSFAPNIFGYYSKEYIQWLYEVYCGVPYEESSVGEYVLGAADTMLSRGILKREETLKLSIPVLSAEEYHNLAALAALYRSLMLENVHDILRPLYKNNAVKLPSHLKSVPKWQQYMFCSDSLPMMLIHQAVERGKFLCGHQKPVPAAILVVERD